MGKILNSNLVGQRLQKPLQIVTYAVGGLFPARKEERAGIHAFRVSRYPLRDLACEIRWHWNRGIASFGLCFADPGVALLAILQGFVNSKLVACEVFNPENQNLGRTKAAGRQNVEHKMLSCLCL